MESKLTNEEIAKVFAMYREQGAKHINAALKDEMWYVMETCLNLERLDAGIRVYKFSEWQLLLTPLSSISDEHAIEVKNLIGASNAVWEIDEYTTKDVANWLLEKQFYMYCHCFQYLISKGYAVPLWFGIDHPCNGKDAIELGIAIDKTKI